MIFRNLTRYFAIFKKNLQDLQKICNIFCRYTIYFEIFLSSNLQDFLQICSYFCKSVRLIANMEDISTNIQDFLQIDKVILKLSVHSKSYFFLQKSMNKHLTFYMNIISIFVIVRTIYDKFDKIFINRKKYYYFLFIKNTNDVKIYVCISYFLS